MSLMEQVSHVTVSEVWREQVTGVTCNGLLCIAWFRIDMNLCDFGNVSSMSGRLFTENQNDPYGP